MLCGRHVGNQASIRCSARAFPVPRRPPIEPLQCQRRRAGAAQAARLIVSVFSDAASVRLSPKAYAPSGVNGTVVQTTWAWITGPGGGFRFV